MAAAKTVEKSVEIADVVDDVKELVEDTVELTEEGVSWLVRNQKAALITAAILGSVAGAAITYLVVGKRERAKAQAEADKQIAEVKAAYSFRDKPDLAELAQDYNTTDASEVVETEVTVVTTENTDGRGRVRYDKISQNPDAVSDLVKDIVTPTTTPEQPSETVTENIFDRGSTVPEFDWDKANAEREQYPNVPYIITKAEFDANETGYQQEFLTFYDGDGVLAEMNNEMIPAVGRVVGDDALQNFGYGSEDVHTVYVRNENFGVDYEITRSENSYSKDVLGLGIDEEENPRELRHSARNRRFRD